MKKIISLLLTIFCSLAVLGGCVKNDEPVTSGVADKTDALVEGTLHKVSVTPSDRKFITAGKSEYKIVVAADLSQANEAALFIRNHIEACSDARLPVINYEESSAAAYTTGAKYIYVGKNAEFEKADLTMPSEDLGECGYYIKSAGNSVFIVTQGMYGYQMGAIAFLRETIGYDMYSANRVGYDRIPSTLPDMEIVERPDFDYRHWSNPLSADALYGMGFSTHTDFISVNGGTVHNTFKWLPKEKFMADHPEWYALDGSQLCYSARGNQEAYEAMQNEIFEQMKGYVDANPGINTIAISQEDDPNYCKCDACKAAVEKYGSINGTTIPFLNDIADKINVYLAEQAEKNHTEVRKLYIIQFAYQQTIDPPVKLQDGKWVPIDDTVRCRDNVGIQIAPLDMKFTRDYDHEDNAYFQEAISKWSAVSDNIYFWWYETNFHYMMFPYNCWDKMVNQYRYCNQSSSRYMFNEGQLGQSNGTAFTKLKDYIDSKALFNVNVNTKEVIDKFFKGYFADAAESMQEYFEELQSYLTYLQEEYSEIFSGSIYEESGASENIQKFWKKKTMDKYLAYIDEAYAAIEKYKVSDPVLYGALYDNITIESLFPRYVLCKYYGSSYESDTITAMRKSFKSDCVRLGNVYEKEHESLEGLYLVWGV